MRVKRAMERVHEHIKEKAAGSGYEIGKIHGERGLQLSGR